MTSIPSHAWAHVAGSARSPPRNSIVSRPTRLVRFPVMKLSMPRTLSPRANSAAAMERPINPATPVTRYRATFLLLGGTFESAGHRAQHTIAPFGTVADYGTPWHGTPG